MGQPRKADDVTLFCGILACDDHWLERAIAALVEAFGPVELVSPIWQFDWTRYYNQETGENIRRQFVSFARQIDPGTIADIKLRTNDIELELAAQTDAPVPRPVNLDPGYVDEAKLVLATTKDYAHRIYVGKGIYAEATLRWHRGNFEPWPWTYLDYHSEKYRAFFVDVRERHRRLKAHRPSQSPPAGQPHS